MISKNEQYILAIEQFSSGWWNEILQLSKYDPEKVPLIAKQAAINFVKDKPDSARPTILMTHIAIEILEQKMSNDNDLIIIKKLRTWFEELGVSPNKIIIIADFVDYLEMRDKPTVVNIGNRN